jgi:predicted lipoprotein
MSLTQWGAVLVGCTALLLTACTVVDLDENGKPIIPADPQAKASFDNQTPEQIAQQTWQSRVLDAAQQHALDDPALSARLKTPSLTTESVFVRLTSQIEKVDTGNGRENSILVRVNNIPITIQIGPVMRGNAIRDATGFKFEDFTNQVQFAQLSRAYNREAVKHLPTVDESWRGKKATVLFAVTLDAGKPENAAALTLEQEAQ